MATLYADTTSDIVQAGFFTETSELLRPTLPVGQRQYQYDEQMNPTLGADITDRMSDFTVQSDLVLRDGGVTVTVISPGGYWTRREGARAAMLNLFNNLTPSASDQLDLLFLLVHLLRRHQWTYVPTNLYPDAEPKHPIY